MARKHRMWPPGIACGDVVIVVEDCFYAGVAQYWAQWVGSDMRGCEL